MARVLVFFCSPKQNIRSRSYGDIFWCLMAYLNPDALYMRNIFLKVIGGRFLVGLRNVFFAKNAENTTEIKF